MAIQRAVFLKHLNYTAYDPSAPVELPPTSRSSSTAPKKTLAERAEALRQQRANRPDEGSSDSSSSSSSSGAATYTSSAKNIGSMAAVSRP
eukprot:455-Heterococcus_DN1.PRE.1